MIHEVPGVRVGGVESAEAGIDLKLAPEFAPPALHDEIAEIALAALEPLIATEAVAGETRMLVNVALTATVTVLMALTPAASVMVTTRS